MYGDGSKPYDIEQYKKVSEETSDSVRLNFEIHDISPILNSQYLLASYLYKGNYIFELKDKELKTQDIIDTKTIEGFQNYIQNGHSNNIIINDNRIYYLALENDDIYLKVFEIHKL